MIRGTIDTGTPSNPPPPPGTLPTALLIEFLNEVSPGQVQVNYLRDTGENADSIVLKWARINQSPDFSTGIPVTLPTQWITNFNSGEEVQFKTVATNAARSVESPVVSITLA